MCRSGVVRKALDICTHAFDEEAEVAQRQNLSKKAKKVVLSQLASLEPALYINFSHTQSQLRCPLLHAQCNSESGQRN